MFAEALAESAPVETDPRPAKVLIVDDDESIVDVLSYRLSSVGFATLKAYQGTEALDLARRERPELVLLDLKLPDVDGLTVCETLADSSETWDIPVIVLSAHDETDIVRRARAAGCRFFVRKPYDPNALLVLIRHALQAWD